ncbi:MAG TPA: hypothetical protein VF381_16410 [Thermoanaerobaculia bacterium]
MKKLSMAIAVMMFAALAFANGSDHGGGPVGFPGDFGGPGGFAVDSNGTIYLTVETAAGTSTTKPTFAIKAISSTGATLWTSASFSGEHFDLVNSNLISVSVTRATSTTAASSTITALSTATGTQAWTLTVDGVVTDIHPFSGGFYAVVVAPPATSGGSATRTLEAISNAGTVLWKVSL